MLYVPAWRGQHHPRPSREGGQVLSVQKETKHPHLGHSASMRDRAHGNPRYITPPPQNSHTNYTHTARQTDKKKIVWDMPGDL